MYVLLEVEVGGTSLEDYRKITSAEAKSILHQVIKIYWPLCGIT